jgi:hypothetical protein
VGAVQPPRRRPGIPALAILVVGLGACATAAGGDAVDVRWYRYGLELRSGDTRYVDPLDSAVVEGRRYRVEAAARGRIVRVATFIGPSKVAEIRYRFDGAGPDANGYDAWAADGERTTRVTIQRDTQGRRIRQEFALLDGRLTSYRVRAYETGRVEITQYTAAGRREGRSILTYSTQDVLMGSRWYPGDASTTYYDTEFDERTGLATGRR